MPPDPLTRALRGPQEMTWKPPSNSFDQWEPALRRVADAHRACFAGHWYRPLVEALEEASAERDALAARIEAAEIADGDSIS